MVQAEDRVSWRVRQPCQNRALLNANTVLSSEGQARLGQTKSLEILCSLDTAGCLRSDIPGALTLPNTAGGREREEHESGV